MTDLAQRPAEPRNCGRCQHARGAPAALTLLCTNPESEFGHGPVMPHGWCLHFAPAAGEART